MKHLKPLFVASLVTLLAAFNLVAQTNPVNSTLPVRDGQVLLPDRPTATDPANATASSLRPPRPERPDLPPPVLTPVERFKREARVYLDREEALRKALLGASDRDRDAIRQRIKVLREQWAERARELRKEFKERRDELADRMPDRQELFNSIRDNALHTLQSPEGHTRPRSGP